MLLLIIRAVLLLAAVVATGCHKGTAIATAPAAARPAASPEDTLRRDLSAQFDDPRFQRLLWSVLVSPLDSGAPLYSRNAEMLVMPGSVLKLATAAAAASRLGWDHRFETRLMSVAPVEGGILRGDLVVVGGGDPSISERSDLPGALRELARAVKESGITKIEGGIVGDDDLYDDRGMGDGWTLDNLPYGYAAPVSALHYNDGSVDLVITAGEAPGDTVTLQVRPDGSGLRVDNRLVTVDASAAGALTLQRQPGSSSLTVIGQIPANAPVFARTASVDNPTRFFTTALRGALIAEGVHVYGDAIDIDDFAVKPDYSMARVLATRRSPTLRDMVGAMLRVSQNQYAELLLRAAGGRAAVREWLRTQSIGDDTFIIADGSGLSRYNYMTATAIVGLLTQAATSEALRPMIDLLPAVGRDGTLARRLAGTPAEGRVRAKTGTIDNVRAIAGYLTTADGETLAFSIIANNANLPPAVVDAAVDGALLRLAAFSRR